jgi:hypothetical protein
MDEPVSRSVVFGLTLLCAFARRTEIDKIAHVKLGVTRCEACGRVGLVRLE